MLKKTKHICDRHIKPKAGLLILRTLFIIYSSYRPIFCFILQYIVLKLEIKKAINRQSSHGSCNLNIHLSNMQLCNQQQKQSNNHKEYAI